jgi:hypothetical protein
VEGGSGLGREAHRWEAARAKARGGTHFGLGTRMAWSLSGGSVACAWGRRGARLSRLVGPMGLGITLSVTLQPLLTAT